MKQIYTTTLFASLLGILLSIGFVSLLSISQPIQAAEDASSTALIAVQFGPGEQVVREISFTAPISGLAALEMSGLPVVAQDFAWGTAVCSINGVGCPADNCFCDSKFWSYEYWSGADWQGYLVGAGDSTIDNGDIEGWRWTEFGVGSLPPAQQLLAAQQALGWLAENQSPSDGGYGSAGGSVESLLTIGANGINAAGWRFTPASPSLFGYIQGKSVAFSESGDTAGKLATGLVGASGCWPHGTSKPLDFYDPITGHFSGQYGDGAGPESWGIVGTASLSQTIPLTAAETLTELQQIDGGWEWIPGGFGSGTDTNSTALAIQALIAAGLSPTSTEIINGLDFLKNAQNDDGGFPYDPDSAWGTASDVNSTAYVVQAILATGEDPSAWTINSTTPISYLLGMQLPDGSFEYQPGTGSNLFSTEQAVPALLGRSFPLAQKITADCPAAFLPVIARSVLP